ncbi:MAG: hypothetical protein R2788_10690 [Saprospiraceae bacterium]
MALIDDTEESTTSRTNFAVNHTKTIGKDAFVKSKACFKNTISRAVSNFTFSSTAHRGDRQHEDRQILASKASSHRQYGLDATDVVQAGVGLSTTKSMIMVSHTANARLRWSRWLLEM